MNELIDMVITSRHRCTQLVLSTPIKMEPGKDGQRQKIMSIRFQLPNSFGMQDKYPHAENIWRQVKYPSKTGFIFQKNGRSTVSL